MAETLEHTFIPVSEKAANELANLEPGSKEARERIAQITHGLGEEAASAVGIVMGGAEGEQYPVAYVNLDPSDPGTHIRRKADALKQGLAYGEAADLPSVEEAYQTLTKSHNMSADSTQGATKEALDQGGVHGMSVEVQGRHAEHIATLGAYEDALNKLSEALHNELIEPEARTRHELDGQIEELRSAINNARLHGGSTEFGHYFDDIRATIDRRRAMFENAQHSLNTFAETSNTLHSRVNTDNEDGVMVARGMSRISEEHGSGSNIQGALTNGLNEQQSQKGALQTAEWALNDNDIDTVSRKLNELLGLAQANGVRTYTIKESLDQSRSSLRALKRALEK
ncbi:MAG TPA: hypothetical protein VFZ58_02205 [Candidatus Saccharimonadales bacterium]